MGSEIENKSSKDKLNYLYLFLGIIILIWILSPIIIPLIYGTLSERAQLGDSFGTINSLFSGLAFAGIIYTILLQRNELALQREELAETREALLRSAKAQEMSERQQRRQSENLKISAKLSALDTLINYSLSKNRRNSNVTDQIHEYKQQEEYAEQIRTILRQKQN